MSEELLFVKMPRNIWKVSWKATELKKRYTVDAVGDDAGDGIGDDAGGDGVDDDALKSVCISGWQPLGPIWTGSLAYRLQHCTRPAEVLILEAPAEVPILGGNHVSK